LFGDLLTPNRALSILVILLGTMYYTWVKSSQPAPPRAERPAPNDIEASPLNSKKTASDTVIFDAEEKRIKGDDRED